jgi:type IV fimbrial biogenesis protein FimT|nr:GspH/FimT family pseudopilin [uncultured Albidiferax sp.]
MKHHLASKGFTLIELMVTMALLAVLLLVATPSMVAFKRNSELTSATNTLFSAINAARGEAMKRGMRAMVVPTNNGSDWSAGWVVFIDNDRSQAFDALKDQVVLTQGAMPSYISISGTNSAAASPPYIMFDASGYSASKGATLQNLTLSLTRTDVASSNTADETRRLKIAATGRARTCKPASESDSTCSATGD